MKGCARADEWSCWNAEHVVCDRNGVQQPFSIDLPAYIRRNENEPKWHLRPIPPPEGYVTGTLRHMHVDPLNYHLVWCGEKEQWTRGCWLEVGEGINKQ